MTKHLTLLLFISLLTIGCQNNIAIEDSIKGGECGFGGE